MLKILGYPSRYSVAPGEEIAFHVSAEDNQPFEATLMRVICGDANPEGPGLRYQEIPTDIDGIYQGRRQVTDAGSYMRADVPQLNQHNAALTFAAMIWPTLVRRDNQTIMSWEDGKSGISLVLRAGGILSARLLTENQCFEVSLEASPMLERQWYAVCLALDPVSRTLTLSQNALRSFATICDSGATEVRISAAMPQPNAPVFIAGCQRGDRVDNHFDGKIDSPRFIGRVESAMQYLQNLQGGTTSETLGKSLAHWDFSREMSGIRAFDLSRYANHGTLFQAPARAMKGWNWDGSQHKWQDDAHHYGAVHFHHDDLYDAAWEEAFRLTIPSGLKSGNYTLRVKSGENDRYATRDYHIPFFVRPPRKPAKAKGSRNKILFLAPTVSYIAYANHSAHIQGREVERNMGRLLEFGHCDLYMYAHPEIGGSLYDKHADGSGVCYSSRLRPVLNFTSQYHSWLGGHGSSVWQYNADTHLFAWLEQNGFDYDVVTDEDLHFEGAALLDSYRVVVTGTHPEYYTTKMWDGLKAWIDNGGNFMYLGANGFYWHVAFNEAMPGLVEVRRAEDGIRTWEAEPGEYYHSSTGELSGLFRRRGHPPNEMCGLGFMAQGFDVCSYYRRAPDSYNPRAAFIFEGVDEEIIGDFGLVGGGAAGLELDAMNTLLGTPPNALRLASSEAHSQMVLLVNEEFGVVPPALGGDQNDKVRADLCYYETLAGGAVFSVGSISWCGSLLSNRGDNNVSRITKNVLSKFARS